MVRMRKVAPPQLLKSCNVEKISSLVQMEVDVYTRTTGVYVHSISYSLGSSNMLGRKSRFLTLPHGRGTNFLNGPV